MNKSEHRHQLIRALVTKNKIHTQAELQALLADMIFKLHKLHFREILKV